MDKEKKIIWLFEKSTGDTAVSIAPLPPSGSAREYYRIIGGKGKAIGVYNDDYKENVAFISFTKHFLLKGLKVPQILAEDLPNNIYLLQDVGDITLFSFLSENRKDFEFPNELVTIYKTVIENLPQFQIIAAKDLDYSVCYPRSSFDKQSMMWDLNYFKYYFLKLAKISFDEQELEDDFNSFCNYLLQANSNYFLYRDFQSRNVMLHNNEPYFIDYQGGRKGALQYDLASLLFDAKADIPTDIRNELLQYYIDVTGKIITINEKEFRQYFYGFVLIRILQAMGAYGYRGFYEHKVHFLKSIPYAIRNLESVLGLIDLPVKLPALFSVLNNLIESNELKGYGEISNSKLIVTIYSFSYMKGIPIDKTGNGGGFVFDCRAIDNPGRYEQYKTLNGRDKAVIEFLETKSKVNEFLTDVYSIVDASVEKYIERRFNSLMVNFGCTGGQHRSVYSAEQLAKHLKNKFNIEIKVNHRELNLSFHI